jgi:hypothetical protein
MQIWVVLGFRSGMPSTGFFNFLVHGQNYIYFKSRAKRDEGHPELGRAGLDPAPVAERL